jgi:hypothetical protein
MFSVSPLPIYPFATGTRLKNMMRFQDMIRHHSLRIFFIDRLNGNVASYTSKKRLDIFYHDANGMNHFLELFKRLV